MKIKLLAALACSALASAAQAQSSVTLYGTLDTAIGYVSNLPKANGGTGSAFQMINGTLSANSWGLKGTEDLGGGLSAVFRLENGFVLSNGALNNNGREFGRVATVGLASVPLGTVTLGRQFDPLVDLIEPLTEDAIFGSAFATPGDLDNYDESLGVNNAVKYVSPSYAGFQWEGMYALGGVAGSASSGQTYALAAAYANGPLNLAAGYLHANFANDFVLTSSGVSLAPGASAPTTDNPYFSSINRGLFSAKSVSMIRAAASYQLGLFQFGAAYSNVAYGEGSLSADTHFNNATVYVNYKPFPTTTLGVGYNFTKGDGGAQTDATYNQVSLGADYTFSKRTDVYALAAYQKASGRTADGTGGSMAATASIGSYGLDSGKNSETMVLLGVRHQF
ncbi:MULTISPECIES: porin [Paraburkholderia]|uniref:porin n=1 Tax=Paraburkholderia TaxID=1822464 RepID=UPI002253D718|nr:MULTISPECIES: porin [Paraburkholderia]MCX4156452.1 porin [Paraburkholderia aspalathi]MDN7165857.1 porin [Paraburkholderia sp. SECH2]MDQ6394343.1 porin [Paraburkholderia aspalathi]